MHRQGYAVKEKRINEIRQDKSSSEQLIDQIIRDFQKNEHELIANESKFADPEIQEQTLAKMVGDSDQFDIISLKKSIQSNGFIEIVQPIMVRKIGSHYLVIEGNRRTSAERIVS